MIKINCKHTGASGNSPNVWGSHGISQAVIAEREKVSQNIGSYIDEEVEDKASDDHVTNFFEVPHELKVIDFD